jgi:hypothetical protein
MAEESTKDLLARIAREDAERKIEERVESLVEQRLAEIERNTRPKPEPVYRSELGAIEKARMIERIGLEAYERLPMWRPGASRKWGRR